MMDIGNVGLIGAAGWLGGAIAKRLIGTGRLPPNQLICSYRRTRPDNHLGCAWTTDNVALANAADIILLCVRPEDWLTIRIEAAGKLVISVMAGVTLEEIATRTNARRVARALPNAAVGIGYGYTPYCLSSKDASDAARIEAIFACGGMVDRVLEEDHIDYFTAMSGSGAAFPALLADALATAAIKHGIPEAIAHRAAEQVLVGAGRVQEAAGAPVSQTLQSFIDYEGTTAAGIRAMRQNGLNDIVDRGLWAAYQKALSMTRGR
ncbi:pyrroline-5-carboxylate reductase family protein [Rhizobium sp. Leaf341]|uniref:pyrroline-5-carboxylate reductase family protein n=1 Tax=Rhizobium sp. Leaf341 TaxID=1736344 RepID=UPI00071381E9|nr:pyrroline-5-carboxylate reductase dimerization domain-containing protein [Rhizobium sp. Leaf341]KQR73002.1 pyrroline-5-carboxylate reductase [Rhizobium sp. Leaf341]